MSSVKTVSEAARNDHNVVCLVRAIRAANIARRPDRTAYAALEDRLRELGHDWPAGYFTFILWALATKIV